MRPRCSGTWTEAQFIAFIKSVLRKASQRWKPINNTFKKAQVSRGIYRCEGYNCEPHNVPVTIKIKNKRTKNVSVDHIHPVVDPILGFISWDIFINNLFCDQDNLQVLCKECHKRKSLEETISAKERRRKEKE